MIDSKIIESTQSYKSHPMDVMKELVKYTPQENRYMDYLSERLVHAFNQRAATYTELDDMDFITYYETNQKAANAYLRPKNNKDEVRIVTGTTQERTNTVYSNLLGYNFTNRFKAFNSDKLEEVMIGKVFTELVEDSRKMQSGEDQEEQLILKELLDQGTVNVEEIYEENIRVDKRVKRSKVNYGKLSSIEWTQKVKKSHGRAKCRLLDGRKVYYGNMREYYMKDQPFVFTMEYISYAEARTRFGDWERFENVPRNLRRFNCISMSSDASGYGTWVVQEYNIEMVEVVKYYDKFANEMQLLLNGVMMLPVGFPMTVVSPSGEYPITKQCAIPISKTFVLGKSFPAKTKVDQALMDEFLRLMVEKTRQSFKPPMANNTGRLLKQDIFNPGNITRDVDPEDIKQIVSANGVTGSEFQMMQFIKNIINEKTISELMGGNSLAGRQTAREIIELKRNSLVKMGILLNSVVMLYKQMGWLRLYNILENYVKDSLNGENNVVTYMVDTDIEDGRTGKRVIRFVDKVDHDEDQIEAEEDIMSESMGVPVRVMYINRNELARIPFLWYNDIIVTQDDVDELEKIMFGEDLLQAMQMFGQQSINMSHAKQQWAIKKGIDPSQFFLSTSPQDVLNQMQGQPMNNPNGGTLAQQLTGGMKAQQKSPFTNPQMTQS